MHVNEMKNDNRKGVSANDDAHRPKWNNYLIKCLVDWCIVRTFAAMEHSSCSMFMVLRETNIMSE